MTTKNYIEKVENFIEEMKKSTAGSDELAESYDEIIQYHPETGDDESDRPADDEIEIDDYDRFELIADELSAGSEYNSANDRENCIDRAISQLKELKKLI